MTKRYFYFIFFLLLSFLINFASSEAIAHNFSVKNKTSFGSIMSGNFSLTLINFEPDFFLTTSEGHSIFLRDFLKLNGVRFNCEDRGCKNTFLAIQPEFSSTVLLLNESRRENIGFLINDERVISVASFFMQLKPSFGENINVPLKILLENKTIWQYSNETNNFSRFFSYGCFNHLANFEYNKQISEIPFCEKMTNVPPAKKVNVGANFSNTQNENKKLIMSILEGNNRYELGKCEFDSLQQNSCVIDMNITFYETKDYFVCIRSNSRTSLFLGYQAKQNSCGYYNNYLSGGDYSIFLRLPTYAGANEVFSISSNDQNSFIINEIDSYLNRNYRKNCSAGCIVPLSFSGIGQNLEIREASLIYNSPTGPTLKNKISNLVEVKPKENLSANLSLDKANFTVNFIGTKRVYFSLTRDSENFSLFSVLINSSSVPLIKDVYPKTIPAFFQTKIFLDLYSERNITNIYWEIRKPDYPNIVLSRGNTTRNYIELYLTNISSYELFIEITDFLGTKSSRNFLLETIEPKEYLNSTLSNAKININKTKQSINNLSVPMKSSLLNFLNLTFKEQRIDYIKSKLNEPLDDEEYARISSELFSLKIPLMISLESKESIPIFIKASDISNSVVSSFIRKESNLDKYKEYIEGWNARNIDEENRIDIYKIAVYYNNSTKDYLPYVITVNTRSPEKGILVIEDQEIIETSISFESFDRGKKIEIDGEEDISFDLLTKNRAPKIYIIPESLKSLEIFSGNVSPCNYNKICEKNLNEDYKNCRNDCKPWKITIFMIIGIFVFFSLIYLFIQETLKRKYEESLFKSRKDLNNLIAFFRSSKEGKSLRKEDAFNNLMKMGWSEEQIKYAYKKSRGERTRPYELIPIEKVKHLFEKNEK